MKILVSKTTKYQFVKQFTTEHADRDDRVMRVQINPHLRALLSFPGI
jgi:hypothetical protein